MASAIPSNEQNLCPIRVQLKPNLSSRFPSMGHCNFRTLSRPLAYNFAAMSKWIGKHKLIILHVIFVLLFIVGVFLYARNRGPPPECLLGGMTGGVIQRRSHDIIRLATA